MSNSTTFVNGTVVQPAWLNDVNTAVFLDHVSAKWFGFDSANTATTNSAALQTAVTYCLTNSKALYIPGSNTPYLVNAVTNIPYNGAITSLRIMGDGAGNYNSTGYGTVLFNTGTSNFVLSATGSGPVNVIFENLNFRGGNNAGVLIDTTWMIKFINCTFNGFTGTAGVELFARGPATYAGNVTFNGCRFEQNTTSTLLSGDNTSGQINVVRFNDCDWLDGSYHIRALWASGIPFTDNVIISGGCSFQNATVAIIQSQGAANNWVIENSYFEQDSGSFTANWIQFLGSNNVNLVVRQNTFRGALNAAAQAYFYVASGNGITFADNYCSVTGNLTSFSADLPAATNVLASPVSVTTGTAYPVRINNFVIQTGPVNDLWNTAMPTGSGKWVGISTGDGFPGGSTVALNTNQYMKINSNVFVSTLSTMTTKSGAGASIILGVLPFSNSGGDLRIPVTTTGITGTQPFHGVLAAGGTTLTLFDATHTALNSSAMSNGATIACNFFYPTQQ